MIVFMKCSTLLNLKDQVLEDDKRLNKTLFNVLRIKNTQKTMKTNKNCKHCYQLFESRRSNHVYCTTSCKTKASYERNQYKYVSGHYKKPDESVTAKLSVPINQELLTAFQALEDKIEQILHSKGVKSTSLKEVAIGTIAADAGVFAVKKIFAPNMLPATKGDIDKLKEELKQLKKTLILYRENKFPTNF